MPLDRYEIYLEYGETDDKQAVHIADARPGLACQLFCPYCGGVLVAKNRKFSGRIKQPHFAHEKDTCSYFSNYHKAEHFRIPLYHNFTWNLRFTENQRAGLHLLYRQFGRNNTVFLQRKRSDYQNYDSAAQELYLAGISNCHQVFDFLRHEGFLERLAEDRNLFRLSKKGQIANGGLPLAQFYTIQQAAMQFERTSLEDALADVKHSRNKADLERTRRLETDRKIFEWNLQKFARSHLYFLEIALPENTVYKVGITHRSITERIKEIRQDLKGYADIEDISPLYLFPGLSSIEPYFKLRFNLWQFKFSASDPHTEYFAFPHSPEQLQQVKQELQRLVDHTEEWRRST